MKVAFIAPAYPPEQRDFTRGLAEVGATVIGIGDGPEAGLPQQVRRYLSKYIRVLEPYFERYDPDYSNLQQKMKDSKLLVRPAIHTVIDKGPIGFPAICWLYWKQGVRGCLYADFWHTAGI